MEGGPQAIDVGLRCSLHPAILLRSCITRRAKEHGVSGLTTLEAARYAKVDEIETSIRSAHYIRGLEITIDNRRFARVQIFKYCAELDANIEHFCQAKTARRTMFLVLC